MADRAGLAAARRLGEPIGGAVSGAALEARRRRSQEAFHRLLGGIELDGDAFATITPQAPHRSLFNAVTYRDDAEAVARARDALAARYADAGVRAWTVWVHPGDDALARALEGAGHHLDSAPEAMGCVLDDVELGGDDLGADPGDWSPVAAINEAAYDVPAGDLAAIGLLPLAPLRRYVVPGRAVVVAYEHDGDCSLTFVATHPSARRQGLCVALMRQAMRGARGRGCTTATLEASPAGRPVYERLGFQALGRLEMWEHRV